MDIFHETLDSLGLSNADGLVFPLTRRCFGVEEEAEEDPVATASGTEAAETTRRRVEESAQFKGMVNKARPRYNPDRLQHYEIQRQSLLPKLDD